MLQPVSIVPRYPHHTRLFLKWHGVLAESLPRQSDRDFFKDRLQVGIRHVKYDEIQLPSFKEAVKDMKACKLLEETDQISAFSKVLRMFGIDTKIRARHLYLERISEFISMCGFSVAFLSFPFSSEIAAISFGAGLVSGAISYLTKRGINKKINHLAETLDTDMPDKVDKDWLYADV